MATFVIETYLARTRASDFDEATTRLRAAIRTAETADQPFRHVRSYYVPDDEMGFHLVEAGTLEDAARLSADAALAADRIVEAEPAAG